MVPDQEFVIRILISAALAALVGIERERQNQPAGLRTLMILAVGSTMAMILSINMAFQFKVQGVSGDPARLAAQVISGIGFLCGGAILHYGLNVRGLTTATSLWTTAIIGLTVGAGHYLAAGGTTLLLLVILVVLNFIEDRYIPQYRTYSVTLKAEDRAGILKEVRELFDDPSIKMTMTSVNKNLDEDRITIILSVRSLQKQVLDTLVNRLSNSKGINSFKIE
jgi:putative Mg2+ transporter-C (MgtC) family protein